MAIGSGGHPAAHDANRLSELQAPAGREALIYSYPRTRRSASHLLRASLRNRLGLGESGSA